MARRKASPVTDEDWALIESMVRKLHERGLRVSRLEIELESTRRLGGSVHAQTGQFTHFERAPISDDLESNE